MLVDYTGKKMRFQIKDGVPAEAEIFVAILPASQIIYPLELRSRRSYTESRYHETGQR